jgi:hypothetical protein
MIGISPALRVATEILLALTTPDTVLGHALSSLFGDRLPLIVLLIHVDLALNDLHDVAAAASDKSFILRNEIVLLDKFELLQVTFT